MFVFKDPATVDDSRAEFANKILSLLYRRYNGDLNKCIEEEDIFTGFDEHIRNIYELISTCIPLYALYELISYGADNYGFTEEEYEEAKERCITASHLYYK